MIQADINCITSDRSFFILLIWTNFVHGNMLQKTSNVDVIINVRSYFVKHFQKCGLAERIIFFRSLKKLSMIKTNGKIFFKNQKYF